MGSPDALMLFPPLRTGWGAVDALVRLLDASGALYLDTQESRGLVPADHPAVVGAVRAAAMTEADLVLVVGRKLDYQLGYGSPAVFPSAERFIRTLKENLLWVEHFDTVEDLRHGLLAFRDLYNETWLIERHGFRPPADIRAAQLPPAAIAA